MSSSAHIQPDRYFLRLLILVYRWVVVVPFLLISTFVLGIIVLVFCFLGAPTFAERVFATTWARLNAAVSMMRVDVVGRDKLDPSNSYIIVANHQSLVDIYVLCGFLGMDAKWTMKKELRAVPIFGSACERMGHILVERGNAEAALAAISEAKEKLRAGMNIVFFPEGTRSRTGELKNFKKGAFRLAQQLNIPILPVAIHGTNNILPSDTLALMPGRATLEFCDPIPTVGMDSKDVNSLTRRARESIQRALESKSWD